MQSSDSDRKVVRIQFMSTIAVSLVAMFFAAVACAQESIRGQVIVMTGQQVPGRAPGVVFREVSSLWESPVSLQVHSRINAAGEFAFVTTVSDHAGQELWAFRSGRLLLIAAEGEQIPGWPAGQSFGAFKFVPGSAGDTDVFFTAPPQGERSSHYLWRSTPAGVDLIGSPELGLRFLAFGIDESIILARLENAALTEVLRLRGGELTSIARVGDPAPGFPSSSYIQSLTTTASTTPLSRDGSFILAGDVAGGGVDAGLDRALWLVRGDSHLELIASASISLPGLPMDQFGELFSASCDAAGDAFYHGYPYLQGEQRWMSWRRPDSEWQQWLATGDAGPQLEDGTTIAPWSLICRPFGDGNVVLAATVEGLQLPEGQSKCIWVADGQDVRLIARSGRRNPFIGRNELLRIPYQSWQEPLVTSPSGRLVFRARVSRDSGATLDACFAIDRVGRVRRILSVRDTFIDPSGIERRIGAIRSVGLGDDGSVVAGVIVDTSDDSYQDAVIRIPADCRSAACDYADVAGSDCAVTLEDVAAVLLNFGEAGPLVSGDADLNDRVDIADLTHVLLSFGMRCDN